VTNGSAELITPRSTFLKQVRSLRSTNILVSLAMVTSLYPRVLRFSQDLVGLLLLLVEILVGIRAWLEVDRSGEMVGRMLVDVDLDLVIL
jgi:hypothetical protein